MRKSFTFLVFALAFIVMLLSGCKSEMKPFTREFFAMDTVISLTVYSDSEEKADSAMDAAEKELFKLAALCDRFSAESDVSRINRNAGIAPVKVSDDVYKMIADSLIWSERTGGAFDITIGPLMNLWNFGAQDNSPPDPEEIKAARQKCGYKKVILDPGQKTVFLKQKEMALDLGGIAKGYATDRAVFTLKQEGVGKALINAGGNVFVMGSKPDGKAFRVGIQNPRNEQGILAVIPLSDKSAVSSGDYQRFYIYNGVRYHHILNPGTGYPAAKMAATTVIGNSAEVCDVLSTSLFVMGVEEGAAFAERLSEIDGALFASDDRKLTVSGNILPILELEDESGFKLK